MTSAERITAWLSFADTIEPFNPGAAAAFRRCAVELEGDVRAAEGEVLTLDQAAIEANMHKDTLRHLVSSGRIPNAGAKGRPRIRRADLPRKAKAPATTGYDPSADALAIAARAGHRPSATPNNSHLGGLR